MENLKRWLSGVPEARILDVATGSGSFFGLILETGAKFQTGTGIDCSERALASARKAFSERSEIRFEAMDAARMNFPDASWDVVSLANSLHHLTDRKIVLREMERVLRPGGILVIQEMIADGLTPAQRSHRKFHHLSAQIDRMMGVCHRPTYSRERIHAWIRDHSVLIPADEWLLSMPEGQPLSEEDRSALFAMLDRIVSRVESEPERTKFSQKAQRIRSHIVRYGWDSCPEMMIVLKKPE